MAYIEAARCRAIVQAASKKVRAPGVKAMLRMDERGAWESEACELIRSVEAGPLWPKLVAERGPAAAEKVLVKEAAVMLALKALTAQMNVQRKRGG